MVVRVVTRLRRPCQTISACQKRLPARRKRAMRMAVSVLVFPPPVVLGSHVDEVRERLLFARLRAHGCLPCSSSIRSRSILMSWQAALCSNGSNLSSSASIMRL